MFWEIWKARNATIFSNLQQTTETIYLKVLSSFMEWNGVKTGKRRIIGKLPSLMQEYPIGFFDGATSKGAYGARFFINYGSGNFIKGWTKASIGTNTHAEVWVCGVYLPKLKNGV